MSTQPETLRGVCIELLNAIYYAINRVSRAEGERVLRHHADRLRTVLNAPERKQVNYARVYEVTQNQHDSLPNALWQLGDCVLIWANEGDLFELGVNHAHEHIHRGDPVRTSSAPVEDAREPHSFANRTRLENLEKRMSGVEDAVVQLQRKEIERGGQL